MVKEKMKKGIAILAFAAMFNVVGNDNAQASSYTAWVEMTGEKTMAINPFYSVSQGAGAIDPVLAYGIYDELDLWFSPGFIMPRYQFAENNIGALFLGGGSFSPQYHFILPGDVFRLELNAYADIPYDDMGMVTLGAIIAPVITISGGLKAYLEIDPAFDVDAGEVSVTVVPGIAYAEDDFGEVSIGVPIDIDDASNPGLALWYWKAFSVK